MIRKITGELVDISTTNVVLDVSGVGYLIYVSKSPANQRLGEVFSYWTHLAVRETALDLYGFTNRDELEIFELLLTLPKIGPKSALQIMSQAEIELLKKAALEDDATYLTKMSGLGKKTAEKIVAGLKDKFESLGLTSGLDTVGHSAQNTQYISDAIDALVSLGYPQSDSRKAVMQLPPEINNANDAVREALKNLGS